MRKYAAGDIDLETAERSLMSWLGHAEQGNTYNLRRTILDRLILKRGTKE